MKLAAGTVTLLSKGEVLIETSYPGGVAAFAGRFGARQDRRNAAGFRRHRWNG